MERKKKTKNRFLMVRDTMIGWGWGGRATRTEASIDLTRRSFELEHRKGLTDAHTYHCTTLSVKNDFGTKEQKRIRGPPISQSDLVRTRRAREWTKGRDGTGGALGTRTQDPRKQNGEYASATNRSECVLPPATVGLLSFSFCRRWSAGLVAPIRKSPPRSFRPPPTRV